MARIGIHSHHLNEPSNEFFKSFVSIYILFTITFFICGSIMFVCINWPQYDVISELCLTHQHGYCHSNFGFHSTLKHYMDGICFGSFSLACACRIQRLKLWLRHISFAVVITSVRFVITIISSNFQDEKNPHVYQKRRREIEEKLIEAVNIHVKIYEYVLISRSTWKKWIICRIFNIVADVNTGVIFALLHGNTLLLGLIMFNADHVNRSLFISMLFCYFALDTIGHMRNIGEIAYDSNWYDYPPEFWKYIILIVAKSQEDSTSSGLNLIVCSIVWSFWNCKHLYFLIKYLLQLFNHNTNVQNFL